MKDRPWPEANRGKPISERWMARNLSRFEIHPKTLRIGEDRAKGMKGRILHEAFDRYLPASVLFSRDSVTCEEKGGFAAVTPDSDVTDEKSATHRGNVTASRPSAVVSENEGFGEPDKEAEMRHW